MGIPKLMQDLLPYAEEAVLGYRAEQLSRLTLPIVHEVVIDGPSLVYYVYSRLYPRTAAALNDSDAQPSYAEISLGVFEFLMTLATQQIEIKAIYFDGALPLGKQVTRLERLEKARGLLENYRRRQPGPFKQADSPISYASGSTFKSSIWKKNFPCLGRGQQLPPPSFMVPCVLDDLRTDPAIKYPVQVVPGEADTYCAAVARSTGAAILSNDSDMTMYDLGAKGSLILLDSLDLESDNNSKLGHTHQANVLKGLRFHSVNIARRLNINQTAANPSLLRYGFERFSDPSAPASTIRSRCTPCLSTEAGEAFQQFRELYQDSREVDTTEDAVANKLVRLDPRLSELFCQYHFTEYLVGPPNSPHVYLPPMVEDHTRDSSWTYGRDIRVIAYSLITLAAENTSNVQRLDSVIEFQRRGPRIVGMPLKLLNKADLKSSTEIITEDSMKPVPSGDVLLKWRLLALKAVNKEKTRAGKPTVKPAWAPEFLSNGYVDAKLSWDDIHIYANMQAVLYSLWLLKQACALLSKSPTDGETTWDNLGRALRTLGPLRCLMASRWEIANNFYDGPSTVVAETIGPADSHNILAGKEVMRGRSAPDSLKEPEPGTPKSKLAAKNKRGRLNQNIFEVLDSS